jgi:hypothetical protein
VIDPKNNMFIRNRDGVACLLTVQLFAIIPCHGSVFLPLYYFLRGNKGKIFPIYAMKAIGGVQAWLHSLTLTLDGGEWSTSHPGHPTPREGTSLPVK